MILRRCYSDPFRRDLTAACFDPGTAAIVSMLTTMAGTGLGIAGQAQRASADAAQANYMAQVASSVGTSKTSLANPLL
jgi:hypothetical protein